MVNETNKKLEISTTDDHHFQHEAHQKQQEASESSRSSDKEVDGDCLVYYYRYLPYRYI
jgi:hypothetical protein